MKTVVQQWGNSLALRIPKAFAQKTSIKKGSPVTLTLESDHMVMKPVKRRRYSLQELVSKITPRNRHAETDWGRSVGKETW